MAWNPNEFDGVTEMPSRGLRGQHRSGNALIRSLGDGDDQVIEINLDDDGLFADDPLEMSDDFHENICDYLYTGDRKKIAQDLCEFFEIDKQSRSDWEEKVKTALRMLGIKKDPSEVLPFEGAANVIHPGIAIACVQFQSRAIEEFFPASGPVKSTVIGKVTKERRDQASRVEDFMNWYYTDGDKGYFPDTDQLMLKLPISGSVFRKSYAQPTSGRPMQRHLDGWDFIAPYNGQDLESMTRYCHRYYMSGNDIKRSIDRGFFTDIELPRGNTSMRMSLQQERRPDDVADDRQPHMHEKDDVYEILEYHIEYKLPMGIDEEYGKDYALPYIIFVERSTQEVLRIERNWKEGDEDFTKRVWFTHYRYLPGLGFYGFGLLHIIGTLGEAATGAVRALLDHAARQICSGGFKSKDLRISGDVRLKNGEWQEVDATAEEMKSGFYTPDVPPANQGLFRLLEILTEGIEKFSSTVEAVVGDAPNTGPVGTTLAMIEQGSKVFSAIHKRTHASARHEFSLFCELIVEFSPYDEYPYAVEGDDKVIFRTDFDERVDVLPVSDPNIWSSTQRIALAQAQVQLVVSDPEVFGRDKRIEAYRRLLVALKAPEAEALLPEDGPQPYLDPVSENMRMMTGEHVKSWPHQDHASHIAVHENWLQMQMNSLPNEVLDVLLPQAMAHIQEHKAYAYQQQVMAQLGMELPIFDLAAGEEVSEPMPPELEMALARATASALLQIPPSPEEQQANAEAMSEEDRKDMAAEREQARKDAAFERDEARKDLKAQLDARRQRMQDEARRSGEAKSQAQRLRLEGLGMVQRVDSEHRLQGLREQAEAKKAKSNGSGKSAD